MIGWGALFCAPTSLFFKNMPTPMNPSNDPEEEKRKFEGDYFDLADEKFREIATNLKSRRKDKVLNIRINSEDLERLKEKAESLGVKYQTFISEILHQAASAVHPTEKKSIQQDSPSK